MLALRKTTISYDECVRTTVLGNAIGNSIVDRATPQTTAGRGNASNSGSWNDDELQEVQVTAKKIDVNPDAIFDVGDIVVPDEWRNIEAKTPSLTIGVTAQRGDSISKILGTSNPKAVEAFMRANNLSGSTIQAGREHVMPSAADFEASDGRIGQAILNDDNRRLADAAAVPGTFSGDLRLAQANGVSMSDVAAARAYSSSGQSYGASLPGIENLYQPIEGYVAHQYRSAVAEMSNSNNSWGDRIVNGTAAVLMAPLAAVDMVGEAFANAPNNAAITGQLVARGNIATDSNVKVESYLAAVSHGASAFNGLAGVASLATTPMMSTAYAAPGVAGSSDVMSAGIASGSRVPHAGGVIRQFTQETDQVYYRVFSENTEGSFLTAVPPRSSAWAQEALALPPGNTATYIQKVTVQAGAQLERSRALAAFGRRGGAEQFQLLQKIPSQNFGSGSLLP